MNRNNKKIIVLNKKKESTNDNKSKSAANFSRIVRFFYWLFLLVFFTLVVYIFLFSGFISFSDVRLQGNHKINDSDLMTVINDKLSAKYFNLISANSYFFVSSEELAKKLSKQFKLIEAVKVDKVFPSRLNVEIKERIVSMAFCKKEDCYLIDENGRVFSRLSDSQDQIDQADLIFLYDEGSNEISIQNIFFEPSEVEFIGKVRSLVKSEIGLATDKTITTPSLVSREYHLRTSEGWDIYFNSEFGIQKEMDMLKVVLEKQISKEDRTKIQYIDLRTENKVYYKIKNEEGEKKKDE